MNEQQGNSVDASSEPHTIDPQIWNSLSEPVRAALVNAQRQSLLQVGGPVDASQLFAGILLLDPATSNGLKVLHELGVNVEAMVSNLEHSGFISTVPEHADGVRMQNRFNVLAASAEVADLFEQARNLASGLTGDQIGTEHLTLAFLADHRTNGFRVLDGFGVTSENFKQKILDWLSSGTYPAEPLAAKSVSPFPGSAPNIRGSVLLVYGWSRIAAMVTIVLPLLYTLFRNRGGSSVLDHYTYYMGDPIAGYIIPYVLSTYAIGFLLRSRAANKAFGAKPLQSMFGLTVPFSVSIFSGVWLLGAILPMLSALEIATAVLLGSPPSNLKSPGITHDHLAPLFCYAAVLVCMTTVVTHWLLTFNVLGPRIKS
jgi:hypothetical protein